MIIFIFVVYLLLPILGLFGKIISYEGFFFYLS